MSKNKQGDTLGERIKYYRREAEMSQEELATKTELYKTGTAISLIESNERGVDAKELPRFAKVLNVPVAKLLGEDVDVPNLSVTLRADEELTEKDRVEIRNFYNYVKKRRK